MSIGGRRPTVISRVCAAAVGQDRHHGTPKYFQRQSSVASLAAFRRIDCREPRRISADRLSGASPHFGGSTVGSLAAFRRIDCREPRRISADRLSGASPNFGGSTVGSLAEFRRRSSVARASPIFPRRFSAARRFPSWLCDRRCTTLSAIPLRTQQLLLGHALGAPPAKRCR